MGTAIFSIEKYGPASATRGELVTSGAHTTSGTASSLTDGATGAGSAITAIAGDVLTLRVDEDARVEFGGATATATSGSIIFANQPTNLHIHQTGAISIIDVA